MSKGLFRGWTSKGKDAEIEKLEQQVEETRARVQQLRQQGRQRREHRLQALDALETRQMTLTEIYKRMEKELSEKSVDDYTDVLAEVFGERKIFAHRAIGLEALLCQFMHQMLAKQHQLKILKRTGKDMQRYCHKHKQMNRDEFHSYEALAVHCETMRLSLEAQYDDVFAAQHALLAQLNHVEAGGTMTNYKVVKPAIDKKVTKRQPSLTVSTKHNDSPNPRAVSSPGGYLGESEDDDSAVMKAILSSRDDDDPPFQDEKKVPEKPKPIQTQGLETTSPSNAPDSTSSHKSARERRREIEQLRLAGVVGRGSAAQSLLDEESDIHKARERMRALEAQRATMAESPTELKERGRRPVDGEESADQKKKEEERQRRRERRKERHSRTQASGGSTSSRQGSWEPTKAESWAPPGKQ